MTLFASIEEFALGHIGITKWDRMMTAIGNASMIKEGVAYSIGDSLTYWLGTDAETAATEFVGHRRYQSVVVALGSGVRVEIAPKLALRSAESYSDLSDRERFVPGEPGGSGGSPDDDGVASWTLSQGQLLAIPIDHAWRLTSSSGAQILLVRITVEGATFHNK